MAFNLGSRLVGNRPLTDYLKEAVLYFKAIELQADPRYLSPNFSFTGPEKRAIRIYQERYRFILTIHAPFVNIRLGALDPEERSLATNKILNSMHIASELGIKLVTFHPCTLEPGASHHYPENCRLEEESIAVLLKEAKKLGVNLLVENMPAEPVFHPGTGDGSRFQELLWLFPEEEFGLTVDIGHALQAGVPIESLLKMERVHHFHLHENDRCLDRHQPITENLDWWDKLLKQLAKKFQDAVGILEMNLLEEQIVSVNNLNNMLKKTGETGKIHK
jgi:sugar phosphate isomerase/epimerase